MERKDLKIVFMGTPEFAKQSLKFLCDANFDVVGVFTNPDKTSGRGLKLQMSPVKEYAISKNIPVFQPLKIKDNQDIMQILKTLSPDVICVTAYGKILPKEILDFPKYGCINVHGSLLPKYRGAAPIQWSIINGDKKTGITTMYMDEGMDTGDMLLKEEVDILDNDNFESLHDKLMIVGANLLVKTLDKLIDGSLERQKQKDVLSYAPMIEKDMGKLDFSKSGESIYNLVRGLSYMGTYFLDSNSKRYKVYEVKFVKEGLDERYSNIENSQIAYITKEKLGIKCLGGYIEIIVIQPENSKRMDVKEFLKGNKFKVGEKLN